MNERQKFNTEEAGSALDFLILLAKKSPSMGTIEESYNIFQAISNAEKTLKKLIENNKNDE